MEPEHDYDIGYHYLINQAYYQALPYLQAAAKQGHFMAQLWLGQLYSQGISQVP